MPMDFMLIVALLSAVVSLCIMLGTIMVCHYTGSRYTKCYFVDYDYAECCYIDYDNIECCYAVIILIVVMLLLC